MQSNTVKAIALSFLFSLWNVSYGAVLIPIKAPEKATSSSADPTLTLLYETNKPPTATLLFIPGGTGSLGLKEGMKLPKEGSSNPYMRGVFLPLVESSVNVVVVDNPTPIIGGGGNSGNDRLDRIESAIRFYKEKFKAPIWLYGLSNGAAAVIDMTNRSADIRQEIAGVFLVSARKQYSFAYEAKFPVVIINHRLDGCDNSPYDSAVKRFESLKEKKVNVKLVTVEGGDPHGNGGAEGGDACHGGYHMFNNAYKEAADAIEMNLPK
jgi:hypothetical protein